MLCASPLAKGLFHGAISQSGGSFGPPRPTTFPGENLKRLADAERAGEALREERRHVHPSRSCGRFPPTNCPRRPRQGVAWPIIDGWVIPDDQYKLYEAKRYNDTPILVGYNSDEGASFSPPQNAGGLHRRREGALRPVRGRLLKAYPTGATERVRQDRARSGARRGVRLAHLDLGAAAGEDRKIQGLLLLLRPASGLSGRFAPRRIRLAARRGCALRVPAPQSVESASHQAGPWRSRRPWPPTGRTSPSTAIPTARAFPHGRPSATPIRG